MSITFDQTRIAKRAENFWKVSMGDIPGNFGNIPS